MKKDGVPQRINKAKLRAMLLLQPEALSIAESTGLYQSHLDTARLDLSEPNEQGQRSQQEQSTVEARSEEQSHLHQKHRNVIELLPFGQKAVVEPDAVVNANNRYFVIAVTTQMISIDGIGINGISVESPLYEVMAGLRVGETVEFQQKAFVVTDVQ